MRRPFQLIPSLPICLLLSWSFRNIVTVEAEPIPGILSNLLVSVNQFAERDIATGQRQNGEGPLDGSIALRGESEVVIARDVVDSLFVREPVPIPNPEAKAKPIAQGNYYAFSGAIYIVGGNGQALNAASPAYCPAQAPQGCGNIGVWNWCCPSGNTCAWADAAQSVVGCCPSGGSCSGTVDRSQIQTVTVYITTTQYQQGPTLGVVNGVQPTTVVVAGGVAAKTTVRYNGYCTTIFAQGGNLPTTYNAPCGTGLVLNVGVRPVARQVLLSVVCFWMLLSLAWAGFQIQRITGVL